MTWLPFDTWIVVVGALCAVACALPGCFLVLRHMSMMGDAISHAVLPGLAIAFLVTGSRASFGMFIGAAIVGVLTAVFTHWVSGFGKVDRGASMGIVFTTLFALGLLLIVRAADHVDLDPGCVLYGAIELTPLDTINQIDIPITPVLTEDFLRSTEKFGLRGVFATISGLRMTFDLPFVGEAPRAAVVIGVVLLINLAIIVALFKELRISSFDPELATTVGINATAMHYLLMAMVAVTTVASFEAVGSIIVIAMLIVPAATAYLLTDRLALMLVISAVVGILAAGLGHLGALTLPPLVGFETTTTSGVMAAAAGLLFTLAWLLGPRHGVLPRKLLRTTAPTPPPDSQGEPAPIAK